MERDYLDQRISYAFTGNSAFLMVATVAMWQEGMYSTQHLASQLDDRLSFGSTTLATIIAKLRDVGMVAELPRAKGRGNWYYTQTEHPLWDWISASEIALDRIADGELRDFRWLPEYAEVDWELLKQSPETVGRRLFNTPIRWKLLIWIVSRNPDEIDSDQFACDFARHANVSPSTPAGAHLWPFTNMFGWDQPSLLSCKRQGRQNLFRRESHPGWHVALALIGPMMAHAGQQELTPEPLI